MTQIRRILLLILTAMMLMTASAIFTGTQTVYAAETGWVRKNNKIYYYDASGNMLIGRKRINGKVYYFGKKSYNRGVLQTGIVKTGRVEFYFKKTGSLGVIGSGVNGWFNIKGRGMCYCIDGKIQKVNCIDDYYLKANGAMTDTSRKMYNLVKNTVKQHTSNAMTQEQKLRACYEYLCSSAFKYVTKRPFSYAADWRLTYGYEMLTTYSGVCYNFSAALAYMARYIGYTDVKAIAGELFYLDTKRFDLHSWTKIRIGGTYYVFDASLEHGGLGNFWKKTYAGTGRQYREWTTGSLSYLNA